jgi:hypothetical protein
MIMTRCLRWFRIWFVTAIVGNALVLLSMSMWFPAAGWDVLNAQHVRLVAASGLAVGLAVILAAVGLALRGSHESVGWGTALVQSIGVIPAVSAVNAWPGGDDGSKMGWTGVVVPAMAILGVLGIGICLLATMGRRKGEE